MAIPIDNPRHVAITLEASKKGQAYQVSNNVQSFLEARDWTHLKKVGRIYTTMKPSLRSVPPFRFNVKIPTKEQVLAIAKAKHTERKLWGGSLGEWKAIYFPSHGWASGEIDPFSDPFSGVVISGPSQSGVIPAVFQVGIPLFWDAQVVFQNDTPLYHESESQPSQLEFEIRGTSLPDEFPETTALIEGAISRITVNSFERNPEARRQCIKAHGTSCYICKFNFETTYGAEAQGYIHVHHLRPLSDIRNDYVIDPIEDLRPVCPNCHAVLHLNGRTRNIDEVKRLLKKTRSGQISAF